MSDPLSRLDEARLDALVLGGGLTGCLTGWELAGFGLRVAVVERQDLAWGASGRWVRLLEGGLGALLTGRAGEARQRVLERGRLVRAAPHLVRPCPALLLEHPKTGPIASAWTRRAPRIQDWLGAARDGWPPVRSVDAGVVHALVPDFRLPSKGRCALGHDALTDGRRLTVAVAAAARASGADVLTRCEAVEIQPGDRRGSARVALRDRLTGRLAHLEVRAMINATGAWIDATRRWSALADAGGGLLEPAWAEAVVLDAPAVAIVRQLRVGRRERGFLAPSLDDRGVLHVPFRRMTPARSEPEGDSPAPKPQGRTEARLRQLVTANERVRCIVPLAHRDAADEAGRGRIVLATVGGIPWIDVVPSAPTLRWWQARCVAARAAKVLGTAPRWGRAARLPGGDASSAAGEEASARGRGLSPGLARWIVRRHGSRWQAVMRSGDDAAEEVSWDAPPLTVAEMIWSFEEEGARTLADLFWRWRLPEFFTPGRRDEEWDAARRFLHQAARRWAWHDTRIEAEWRRWQRERNEVYRPDPVSEEGPR
jgi:glycerol-3-phosphate dehydrogenase